MISTKTNNIDTNSTLVNDQIAINIQTLQDYDQIDIPEQSNYTKNSNKNLKTLINNFNKINNEILELLLYSNHLLNQNSNNNHEDINSLSKNIKIKFVELNQILNYLKSGELSYSHLMNTHSYNHHNGIVKSYNKTLMNIKDYNNKLKHKIFK